jgi:hypothetical protein
MKKWSKIPITIRAAIIGGLITLIGTIFTILNRSQITIVYPETTLKVQNPDTTIVYPYDFVVDPFNTDYKPKRITLDAKGQYIAKQIKKYYQFDSLFIFDFKPIDLDNNGLKDEYFISYIPNSDQMAYYDVFRVREREIINIYHDYYYPKFRDYNFIKFDGKQYLIKSWNGMGSGAYLDLEIFTYNSMIKLSKIYSLPDSINNFQGHLFVINEKIYLNLADKRYLLIKDNQGFRLQDYNERIRLVDLQNTEHLLRFDENRNTLLASFDHKPIKFEEKLNKHNEKEYFSIDTVAINKNDVCWIDDNSPTPLGLRIFSESQFEYKPGFFGNFIVKGSGEFVLTICYHGYEAWYHLNFRIDSLHKEIQ